MTMSALVGREITDYSDRVPGTAQNFDKSVQFDVTDGFVGITQYDGQTDDVTDRVLLSPQQWRELVAFVKRAKLHRRRIR